MSTAASHLILSVAPWHLLPCLPLCVCVCLCVIPRCNIMQKKCFYSFISDNVTLINVRSHYQSIKMYFKGQNTNYSIKNEIITYIFIYIKSAKHKVITIEFKDYSVFFVFFYFLLSTMCFQLILLPLTDQRKWKEHSS